MWRLIYVPAGVHGRLWWCLVGGGWIYSASDLLVLLFYLLQFLLRKVVIIKVIWISSKRGWCTVTKICVVIWCWTKQENKPWKEIWSKSVAVYSLSIFFLCVWRKFALCEVGNHCSVHGSWLGPGILLALWPCEGLLRLLKEYERQKQCVLVTGCECLFLTVLKKIDRLE